MTGNALQGLPTRIPSLLVLAAWVARTVLDLIDHTVPEREHKLQLERLSEGLNCWIHYFYNELMDAPFPKRMIEAVRMHIHLMQSNASNNRHMMTTVDISLLAPMPLMSILSDCFNQEGESLHMFINSFEAGTRSNNAMLHCMNILTDKVLQPSNAFCLDQYKQFLVSIFASLTKASMRDYAVYIISGCIKAAPTWEIRTFIFQLATREDAYSSYGIKDSVTYLLNAGTGCLRGVREDIHWQEPHMVLVGAHMASSGGYLNTLIYILNQYVRTNRSSVPQKYRYSVCAEAVTREQYHIVIYFATLWRIAEWESVHTIWSYVETVTMAQLLLDLGIPTTYAINHIHSHPAVLAFVISTGARLCTESLTLQHSISNPPLCSVESVAVGELLVSHNVGGAISTASLDCTVSNGRPSYQSVLCRYAYRCTDLMLFLTRSVPVPSPEVLTNALLAVCETSALQDTDVYLFRRIKLLILLGADVNGVKHQDHTTPLMWLCQCSTFGDTGILQFLQRHGARTEMCDTSGRTGLHHLTIQHLNRTHDHAMIRDVVSLNFPPTSVISLITRR